MHLSRPISSLSLSALTVLLAACGDDVVVTEPNAACEIRERVRIAEPPAGWARDDKATYDLHVFDDLVLYTFDDRDDPARAYWRLDRCTGDVAPFPSLTPGLHAPYVVDTPAGRVLYAIKDDTSYVVDRLDVPGDDEPRALDVPDPGLLGGVNLCNLFFELPYACLLREGDVYTHAGDPQAPAFRATNDAVARATYPEAILATDTSGNLLRIDPFSGASALLLSGAQYLDIVDAGPLQAPTSEYGPLLDPAATIADARVLWQPIGETTLYLRRVGDGNDIPLAVDPALIGARAFMVPAANVVVFVSDDGSRILAAVRADTGAALVVPEHVDYSTQKYGQGPLSLTIAGSTTTSHALWDPLSGTLRTWYSGAASSPKIWRYDGDSVDYYLQETDDPPIGSLWRVDLDSGETRQLAARVGSTTLTNDRGYLYRNQNEPYQEPTVRAQSYDVAYLDLASSEATSLVDAAAATVMLPDEGVVYLDARGPAPGVWVAPLPGSDE